MIDKKQVENIAKLARLDLTKSETTKMQKELSGILNFVEQLDELDAHKIKPTRHSTSLNNVFRDDKARQWPGHRKILDQMPKRQGDYLKTKQILE